MVELFLLLVDNLLESTFSEERIVARPTLYEPSAREVPVVLASLGAQNRNALIGSLRDIDGALDRGQSQ